MTDNQLAAGCKEGNVLIQRQLYDRYHPKMLGVCIRYAQNRQEAQDILQDGFIKVYMNISSYKGTGSLEGWIKKIIINTALEHYRKTKALKQEVELEKAELNTTGKESTIDELKAQDILDFIHQLPTGYRVVFNLFAIEGYSHEEIAKRLNISVNTSYSQYHRARALLQKTILSEKETTPKLAV